MAAAPGSDNRLAASHEEKPSFGPSGGTPNPSLAAEQPAPEPATARVKGADIRAALLQIAEAKRDYSGALKRLVEARTLKQQRAERECWQHMRTVVELTATLRAQAGPYPKPDPED